MTLAHDRRSVPATQRNRAPILDILRRVLPASGIVLEIASGTGEHACHFAGALPGLVWQPSDPADDARRSIAAWARAEDRANILPPVDLDASSTAWPVDRADAVICINMIHISPWEATEGLMRGVSRILPVGAPLYLYGPFRHRDHPLEPSNHAFDLDLKRREPRWGLRDLEDVEACASGHALVLEEVVEMPANNLSVIFRRH